MNMFLPGSRFQGKKAKIKVVGVGGGGGNAVNRMVSAGIAGVDFIALNTDAQDLQRNEAPCRIQLGKMGLGVGGDPEKGRKAAEESYEQIRQVVSDADLLFVTAGMGGGTGTGAAPVAARIAREAGGDEMLIIGVVTRPFNFEGYRKSEQAELGVRELRNYVDSLLVIPNDRLYEIFDKEALVETSRAFVMADDVLRQAIQGISDVITIPGEMNVDFNDVKRIMAKSGEALIGIGEMSGQNRHIEAARRAITSPLLENADIEGAKGLIVNFMSSRHYLNEQKEVIEYIKENASKDAFVKFGMVEDRTFGDKVRITVIATGFPGGNSDNRRGRVKKKQRFPSPDLDAVEGGARQPEAGGQPKSGLDEMMVPAFLRRGKRS